MDDELDVMSEFSAAFRSIEKNTGRLTEDEQERVLRWVYDKFLWPFIQDNQQILNLAASTSTSTSLSKVDTDSANGTLDKDLPGASGNGKSSGTLITTKNIHGIAHLDERGRYVVDFTDVKADSRAHAAVNSAIVLVYSYCDLRDEEFMSSKDILVRFLKLYDLYTGTNRAAIKSTETIIREGDRLSLTTQGTIEAERIIEQIRDPNYEGLYLMKAMHEDFPVSHR